MTPKQNPEPQRDFDCWTDSQLTAGRLHELGATHLKSAHGFAFYEHPLRGDEAPVLAVRQPEVPSNPVWNTQDFDLPTHDPLERW